MSPELRTVQYQSEKITQDLGFDEMAMTQVISSTTRSSTIFKRYHLEGNVEINLEETRLAKRNVFTDIAVRYLRS